MGKRLFFCFLFLSFVQFVSINLIMAGNAEHEPVLTGTWPEKDCFEIHLRDAIERNKKVKPVYSKLTDGKTDFIFDFLHYSDEIAALWVKQYDKKAEKYHKAGIPIICEELAPVTLPKFRNGVKIRGNVPEKFQPLDGGKIADEIKSAIKKQGWSGALKVVNRELARIEDQPYFHCLMRNELTSIRRIATLAPYHEDAAFRKGLEPTTDISMTMIKSELRILNTVDWIDGLAYPVQKRGIPVLCQDFPGFPAQ